MGKASDWLREERRKTLGDWVAFCLECGHAQRYFEEDEPALTAACPACGGPMRHRCPACAARFSSVFAVDCEACGAALRPGEAFGGPIRRTAAATRRESRRSESP
jgi:ribosomal protein S27E